MSLTEAPIWISKETSHRTAVRYQSEIVHEVNPVQRELAVALKNLEKTTDTFVDYLPLGRLGISLASLDPVIRQILSTDKRGIINNSARKEFERDLNESLAEFHGKTITVPSSTRPLGVFGHDKSELGIRLDVNDPLLFGERVLVERFIRIEHPAISERFGEEILNWEPHIPIGAIRPGTLTNDQLEELQVDTNGFIHNAMQQAYDEMEDRFGLDIGSRDFSFPDELALGGLRIVCNKQPDRIF